MGKNIIDFVSIFYFPLPPCPYPPPPPFSYLSSPPSGNRLSLVGKESYRHEVSSLSVLYGLHYLSHIGIPDDDKESRDSIVFGNLVCRYK